ncbi:hypothetical protein EVAR_70076_1 [Eumeta japonica]|uniref:Uncharacterized protein n=1 Tax=Eumeta variegata TaxID=151549 RepID=A0A4C2AAC8_EUMVA|nr:hypothetical protein EVAR_70076_1 [Eumeta japonica]
MSCRCSGEHHTSDDVIDVSLPHPAVTEARTYWFRNRGDGRRNVASSRQEDWRREHLTAAWGGRWGGVKGRSTTSTYHESLGKCEGNEH